MLRDFSEKAKNLGAHIAKRNSSKSFNLEIQKQKHIFSVTRMEGKSDLLDLTNSIDEDEEPVDSNTDTDTDEQEKTWPEEWNDHKVERADILRLVFQVKF